MHGEVQSIRGFLIETIQYFIGTMYTFMTPSVSLIFAFSDKTSLPGDFVTNYPELPICAYCLRFLVYNRILYWVNQTDPHSTYLTVWGTRGRKRR
jgi:hypothetical protein